MKFEQINCIQNKLFLSVYFYVNYPSKQVVLFICIIIIIVIPLEM